MHHEYVKLAVRALDSDGYHDLAEKLDNNGIGALDGDEFQTVIRSLKRWKPYLDGNVDRAVGHFRMGRYQ